MIGIIGGSGFYKFLDNPVAQIIETPFGDTVVNVGEISSVKVGFIPRHGTSHSVLPSQINYRANIFAAHKLGMDKIYATNAVGSLNKEVKPGTFAVPDQILDFTSGRDGTFFDGSDLEVTTRSGKKLKGVIHTDVTDTFDSNVRANIIDICKKLNEKVINGGTLVCVNGPRYETPAEIKAYRLMGADYAGMTSSPEAFLAKELELPYATLALITNYAAGMQKSISHEEVSDMFDRRMDTIKEIFTELVKK